MYNNLHLKNITMCEFDVDGIQIKVDDIKILPTLDEIEEAIGNVVYGAARKLDTVLPLAGIVPATQDKVEKVLEKIYNRV